MSEILKYAKYSISIGLAAWAFQNINSIVTKPYLDEIFHIPQTITYCEGNFKSWDNKITTPPGLYFLGYLYGKGIEYFGGRWLVEFEGSYHVCGDVTILRSLNLIGVLIVIPLLVFIIQGEWLEWKGVIVGVGEEEGVDISDASYDQGDVLENHINLPLIISNFPLIMFFANLFYTDIWSTIFVFGSLGIGLSGYPIISAVLSIISLTFRQTNIIWAAFIGFVLLIKKADEHELMIRIEKVLEEQEKEKKKSEKDNNATKKKAQDKNKPSRKRSSKSPITTFISRINTIIKQTLNINKSWSIVVPFSLVALSFGVFVKLNKGITLGDKSNHQLALNIPQFFYFTLFLLFFSLPLYITKPQLIFKKYIPSIIGTPFHVVIYVFSLTAIAYFVSEFTIIHPFILADNRHYTFYLWRRLINPSYHEYAKYLLVPIYHFGLWLITYSAFSTDPIIAITYLISVALTLIPSPLLEPRYYIIPYTIWRILFAPQITTNKYRLAFEFLWYVIINFTTIYLFLYHPFIWSHDPQSGLQRFMW